jgi:general secretion pathway protein J
MRAPGNGAGRPEPVADEAGLTLIELLVAITLLGLLMAALFGGLQLGARAWERSEERLDQSTRLQVVQDFLRDRLLQAYPLVADDEVGAAGLTFEGTADQLRFVTMMPEHLGAGFAEFVLAQDDQSDAKDLVVRWRRFDWPALGPVPEEDAQVKVLLARIEFLEISYFGVAGRDQVASWHDQWQGARAIPELIRIRVGFAPEDHRRWPDLVVHPMVDAAIAAL